MNPKISKASIVETPRDSERILMLLSPMNDKPEDEVVHRKCLVITCQLMDGQMDR